MTMRTALQQRERAGRKRWIAVTGAVAAAATAVSVVLAQSGDEGGSDGGGAGSALPPLDVETGVVHVHGLGVDPGDGVLYAATHSGLFRVPEQGRAARVANRAQDTMGFSIVGPGRFIGSGHPDFREDDVRPPLLGLIECDDRGQTWDRISLLGKADFHALHAAHGNVYGNVYGYDSTSQTFMASCWTAPRGEQSGSFGAARTSVHILAGSSIGPGGRPGEQAGQQHAGGRDGDQVEGGRGAARRDGCWR